MLAVLHAAHGRERGAKQHWSEDELRELARVDATHHALVAYAGGEREPFALARLVRDGGRAELRVDGAGRRTRAALALAAALLADARAAGIAEVVLAVPVDANVPAPASLAGLRLAAAG